MSTVARQVFDAEQARLAAAAYLPPALFVEFQRLAKTLIHGPSFQLLIVDCLDERLRFRVLESLSALQRQAGLRGVELALDASVAGDVSALETRLIELAHDHDVIHLLGASVWMDDAAWQSFNLVRERLATHARVRLVFWLNEASIARVARHAADIWAWRGGVYLFIAADKALDVVDLQRHSTSSADQVQSAFDSRSMKERYQRIAEIRSMLDSTPTPSDDLRAPVLEELAYILTSFGESQNVIELVEEEMLPLADRLADPRLLAEAWTYWADAKNSLGDLDSALQVYREKILPIRTSRLDDREVAMIQGRIADVLQARGDLKEALRIRWEEELPVYEKLGDARSRAVTMGKIADVLQARGDLEEALRIRRELLPVFEKLGDARARAVTMDKIADVLQARGDLEEALRIRREEALPVYEKLGDVRARAVTMGKIADVLQARGDLEEALRIRREEELPVYEKLGDVRSRAVTMGQIADVLQARGDLEEALRIRREEELPVYEKLGDVRERAVTMGKIADVLLARGDLEEALRILREEELPVYEKLGLERDLLVTRMNLAIVLHRRKLLKDKNEINVLLRRAYAPAKRMKIPEAQRIATLYKNIFRKPIESK